MSVYKAQTGEHRAGLDIRCDKIQLLSPKKGNETTTEPIIASVEVGKNDLIY